MNSSSDWLSFRFIARAVVLLSLAAMLVIFWRFRSIPAGEGAQPLSKSEDKNVIDEKLPISGDGEEDDFLYVNGIIENHGSPDLSARDDVSKVQMMAVQFAQYNKEINSIYYSNNEGLTQLMLGGSMGLKAQLSSEHPIIGQNSAGEEVMIDRWNSPYKFHLAGGKSIEVRSAGPDKILYTSDDIITP